VEASSVVWNSFMKGIGISTVYFKYDFLNSKKFQIFGHQIPGSGSASTLNDGSGSGSALKLMRIITIQYNTIQDNALDKEEEKYK
jgi:hypothetical protein